MKLPKIISKEEFEKILKAEEDKNFKLAYLLAFESGLRISEIVGFKKKDGNWRFKPLQKEQIEGTSIRIIGKGKGEGKTRIVPRPSRLTEKAIARLPLDINRRTLQRRFSNLTEKIIGKKLNFHCLRHGFCSYLANSGMALHQVQMLAGHSNLATTGIYLHANPKDAIKEAQNLFG